MRIENSSRTSALTGPPPGNSAAMADEPCPVERGREQAGALVAWQHGDRGGRLMPDGVQRAVTAAEAPWPVAAGAIR